MYQFCKFSRNLARLLTLSFIFANCTDAGQLKEYNCIDQDGKEVDWYIVYQMPRKDQKYLFMTSPGGTRFTLGRDAINHPNSTIFRTLNPFISNDPGTDNFFVYNDDTSFSDPITEAEYAHAKGIIVYGQIKGFWLWHSIPRLTPFPGQAFTYPDTDNGQIAACFSFDSSSGHDNRYAIEGYLASIWAYCRKSITGGGQCKPFSQVQDFYWFPFSTIGNPGITNQVFYKPRELRAEIYQVVANYKGTNWFVQSWHYDDYTDTPNIRNIAEIKVEYWGLDGTLLTDRWSSRTLDHSKFAVDSEIDTGEFCIGDLNRATTQHLRGGGILCLPRGRGPSGVTVY